MLGLIKNLLGVVETKDDCKLAIAKCEADIARYRTSAASKDKSTREYWRREINKKKEEIADLKVRMQKLK